MLCRTHSDPSSPAPAPARGGLAWKWFRLRQEIYQRVLCPKSDRKNVLFIVGCQRSGTTMMTLLFQRDMEAKVYREISKLSSRDTEEHLRFDPLEEVRARIERNRTAFVIAKPLVESQNVARLLEFFPGARALWMYRHYRDVAASYLKMFGNETGVVDLRPIVEGRGASSWRSEKVSEEVRQIIAGRFSEEMSRTDAAGLFWYVRNRFFFDQDLGSEPRVLLCRYEDMVTEPAAFMRRIYAFVGRAYPGDHLVGEVHRRSVKKGKEIVFSGEVEALCKEMWRRLEGAYEATR